MKAIDFDKIMISLQGSTDLLRRVIEIAAEDWAEQLKRLDAAIKTQDFDEIHKRLHRIKGSVQSLYYKALVSKLEDLELAAEKKQIQNWPIHLQEIKADLDFLKSEVQNFINTKT